MCLIYKTQLAQGWPPFGFRKHGRVRMFFSRIMGEALNGLEKKGKTSTNFVRPTKQGFWGCPTSGQIYTI